MKVLKEATKEKKVVPSPGRSMRNPVANGVTGSHIDVKSDAIKPKLTTDERDLEEKFSPSRHQSMRRSRTSGELERDMALPALHPSARPPTTTALNPVTPLRWKSSKRLELEKKKLQDEIIAREVVKEEKKNSKPAKEERNYQSKMTERPYLEANIMEASHKADTPITGCATSQEEEKRLAEVGRSNGDLSGTDRKPLSGDEPTVITVDFLRARLLAERGSSKAAKERIQQLTKKVLELESRLDQEIQSRKKSEESAQEALLKFELLEKQASKENSKALESSKSLSEKLPGPNYASETAVNMSLPGDNEPVLPPHGKTKTEEQDQELSDQVDEKCQVPVEVDDARPNATVVAKLGHMLSISLDTVDGYENVTSEDNVTPPSEQMIGDRHGIQSLEKVGLLEVKQDINPTVPRLVSISGESICSANSGRERQERRFAVEERLRRMWDQITEEMTALAEDKTQEEIVREELLNWMSHVPRVLQDILPKPSEEKKKVIESSTTNAQLKDGDVPPASFDFDEPLKEDTAEDLSLNGAPSSGDRSRIRDQGLKKVASLIERFEAQESTQREWELSYAKQNSTGRRRSNEGSLSRTNSNSGTPHSVDSQQESRLEHLVEVAPKTLSQIEDPRDFIHITNPSVSPRQGISEESILIRKENGEVEVHTPEISISSTYPDPPTVGEIVERSGNEGGSCDRTYKTKDSILEDAKAGSEGSLDRSFDTAPLHSASSEAARAGENGGVIRSSLVDRSQVLKQSNHYLSPRALEGTYDALADHSSRRNIERGEPPARSQAIAGWVKLEEAHTYRVPTIKGNSSLQRDASIMGLHLQQEKFAHYSQAGNSNAYIRPEVPCNYPLRNDEREIYRGRSESVSRSMEGLEGSWRSLSEGDEILQPYADIPESNESGITRRSALELPFQVNGGSGRSNYYQAENMVGTSQSFAYPGREFSRENFQSRPSPKIESNTSKVNEVLKALQLAKLSIQNTGGRRTSISNPSYSTIQQSYSGGEKLNRKTDYGFYGGGGMTNGSPVGIRVWSHQELSRRYSTGNFREAGSPPRLQRASSTAPFGMLIDARGKDPEEDHPLAGRSSPVSNARSKFVDKNSTRGGMQYFCRN